MKQLFLMVDKIIEFVNNGTQIKGYDQNIAYENIQHFLLENYVFILKLRGGGLV